MSKMSDWREANTAGYYCLHDVLPKLGLIAVRDHKTVITDVARARAFLYGVRQRLMLLDQMCMDSEISDLLHRCEAVQAEQTGETT